MQQGILRPDAFHRVNLQTLAYQVDAVRVNFVLEQMAHVHAVLAEVLAEAAVFGTDQLMLVASEQRLLTLVELLVLLGTDK